MNKKGTIKIHYNRGCTRSKDVGYVGEKNLELGTFQCSVLNGLITSVCLHSWICKSTKTTQRIFLPATQYLWIS